AEGQTRLALWFGGVLCEYIAPMIGLRFPGLGRSLTSDWTIDGGHLAERCQLFVIVALGESVLATGIAFGHHAEW
ncbi:low temperature requirement protein A, partial [Pseudomonas aeruginosa]|uniref:low temperature requirement protein A n=2 Tax=Pseudomonadota TaxID=1224 RepID=UPI0015ADF7C6